MPLQPGGHQLSSEQIALSLERKRKRADLSSKNTLKVNENLEDERSKILSRRWLVSGNSQGTEQQSQQFKVMTWNMLAQTLVRRELFPTSDCLKAHQRESMLYREIRSSEADIICLQEVDRLEKLIPALESAHYSHIFSSGPHKKHGCLIAYRTALYEKTCDTTVYYDDAFVRPDGEDTYRKGGSFRTKNIGLVVALKRTGSIDEGVIVATTHLFWHPRHNYERARQIGILAREVVAFRDRLGHKDWPCIIAGDFNFPPDNAAYSLVVGDPLLPEQKNQLSNSRVVHFTVDPTVPIVGKKSADEEDAENDPDKIITNARGATPEDGLLEEHELVDLFRLLPPMRSVYDEWGSPDSHATFGSRVEIPLDRRGRFEPLYTSYTHYWKTVLDYIFVINPPERPLNVLGLLESPDESALSPGLPRMGICGSDHISLMASVAWPIPMPLD